jgi:transposase
VRENLNGILYVLSTGCQWQALPKDLPPKSTIWAYFDLWTWDGALERIHHALYVAVREQAGCGGTRAGGTGGKPDHGDHRQPECQGRAKKGAAFDPQGFDAGKKIRVASATFSSIRSALAERGGACPPTFRIETG